MRLARSRVAALALGLAVIAGCGRLPAPQAAGTPAGPSLSAAAAEALVTAFFSDVAKGEDAAAAALWTVAWQQAHPVSGWVANPPLPPGVSPQFQGTQTAGAGERIVSLRAVATNGALGQRWALGSYTVGLVSGQPRLLAGGLRPPTVPQDLQGVAVPGAGGAQTGSAACGGYTVSWSMKPHVGPGGGALSTIRVTDSAGKPVALPALPAFSFGTVPTWCGDLLADGGTDLMLTTTTANAHYYRQAVVYALHGDSVSLIGQVSSEQDSAYPRPVAEDGLVPYSLVATLEIDAMGSEPIVAPMIWAPIDGFYQLDTAAYTAVLQQDIVQRLADPAAWTACHQGFTICAAPDLLRAYYDYSLLGQSGPGLTHLESLIPAGERAWLRQQAQIVSLHIALP